MSLSARQAHQCGLDATEFRQLDSGEPVMTAAHKLGMIRDLYAAGWSYRLIAQFCGCPSEEIRDVLVTNGASLFQKGP